MDRCNEFCTKDATGSCAVCDALAERTRFERRWFQGGILIEISLVACEEEAAISSLLFFAVSVTDCFAFSTPDHKSEAFQTTPAPVRTSSPIAIPPNSFIQPHAWLKTFIELSRSSTSRFWIVSASWSLTFFAI